MQHDATAGITGIVGVIANINTVDVSLVTIMIFIGVFSYITKNHERRTKT